MSGCERNDNDRSTPATHIARPNNGAFVVITALHENIRAERRDQLTRRILIEHHDDVDHLERGQYVTTLSGTSDGTFRTFESPNGRVSIHADDERIAVATRAQEDVDVAGVKQIENAVGERDSPCRLSSPRPRAIPIHDFVERVERHAQSGPSACGWKEISRTYIGNSTNSV